MFGVLCVRHPRCVQETSPSMDAPSYSLYIPHTPHPPSLLPLLTPHPPSLLPLLTPPHPPSLLPLLTHVLAHSVQCLHPRLHVRLIAAVKHVVPPPGMTHPHHDDALPAPDAGRGYDVITVTQVDGLAVVLGALVFGGVVLHDLRGPQHEEALVPLLL